MRVPRAASVAERCIIEAELPGKAPEDLLVRQGLAERLPGLDLGRQRQVKIGRDEIVEL
jgi:hypothetical protein